MTPNDPEQAKSLDPQKPYRNGFCSGCSAYAPHPIPFGGGPKQAPFYETANLIFHFWSNPTLSTLSSLSISNINRLEYMKCSGYSGMV